MPLRCPRKLVALVVAIAVLVGSGGISAGRKPVYFELPDRPGWMGELPSSARAQVAHEEAFDVQAFGPGEEFWRGDVEVVSWQPRVLTLRGFLSDAECDRIINLAAPKLAASSVVDDRTGGTVASAVRTSTGAGFDRAEDDVIEDIEARIALFTRLPEEHGEGLQVLHYEHGQQYRPHHDSFRDDVNLQQDNGGQRIATILMYLSDVEEGGETVFPLAKGVNRTAQAEASECTRVGLAIKPRKGDATLFYSLHPDGKPDSLSLHASCPTIKGEKWVATKWLRERPFGRNARELRALRGECIDGSYDCPDWAEEGECDGPNQEYMRIYCKPSCGLCTPVTEA